MKNLTGYEIAITGLSILVLILAVNTFRITHYNYSGIVYSKDKEVLEYTVTNCKCDKENLELMFNKVDATFLLQLNTMNHEAIQFGCDFDSINIKYVTFPPASTLNQTDNKFEFTNDESTFDMYDEVMFLRKFIIMKDMQSELKEYMLDVIYSNDDSHKSAIELYIYGLKE